MKLASIKVKSPRNFSEAKDGRLVVVDTKNNRAALLDAGPYPTMISALEDWHRAEQYLRAVDLELSQGTWSHAAILSELEFHSPLPRTYAFLDGSAFLEHVRRVRKARNAPLPENLETDPLMYQGLSDSFLDPRADLPLLSPEYDTDFESEIGVILSGAPMGVSAEAAESSVALLVILNDISLRGLIPKEIPKQFGFVQSKPASSFAPFAVTKDELGSAWHGGRAYIDVETKLNGKVVGRINGREMHFSFHQLIAHAAKTRVLTPGTIIGSGTVSSLEEKNGVGCLVEKRVIEILKSGTASTPFLKTGDRVRVEALIDSESPFGAIEQICRAQRDSV